MAFHLNQAPEVEIHVKTTRKVRNGGVVAHVRGACVGRLQQITDALIVERVTIFSQGDHHRCACRVLLLRQTEPAVIQAVWTPRASWSLDPVGMISAQLPQSTEQVFQ